MVSHLLNKLKTYGALVMFSHTLFSLPFALIAMFLAADGLPSFHVVLWILIALFAGRNGANALNRYVDAEIDRKNPRTRGRHIPSGKVRKHEALWITFICYALFVFAAYKINTVCFLLSPVALGLFTLYSYTKRFTWLCHLILGITCAGAPVGAWLAIRERFDLIPFVIAAIVSLWVAGFDIIYGTQDIDFDRASGLFSIPAKFGYKGGLWIARGLHLIMWFLLCFLFLITDLGAIYLVGVFISVLLLILEHLMVDPEHPLKMNIASYHINQVISLLLLIATTTDVFI